MRNDDLNGQAVYILSAARTPIGKLMGRLSTIPATELGGTAIRAALERAGLEPSAIDEVIMGQVIQAGAGQAPARQASIGAGIPTSANATTLNKVCASGMEAINQAAHSIRAGDSSMVIAGGLERMSQGPQLLPKGRCGGACRRQSARQQSARADRRLCERRDRSAVVVRCPGARAEEAVRQDAYVGGRLGPARDQRGVRGPDRGQRQSARLGLGAGQ